MYYKYSLNGNTDSCSINIILSVQTHLNYNTNIAYSHIEQALFFDLHKLHQSILK